MPPTPHVGGWLSKVSGQALPNARKYAVKVDVTHPPPEWLVGEISDQPLPTARKYAPKVDVTRPPCGWLVDEIPANNNMSTARKYEVKVDVTHLPAGMVSWRNLRKTNANST